MHSENVWVDKYKYDDAEEKYFILLSKSQNNLVDCKQALRTALLNCLPVDIYYQLKDAERNLNENQEDDAPTSEIEEVLESNVSCKEHASFQNYWPNKIECNDAEVLYYELCAKMKESDPDNDAKDGVADFCIARGASDSKWVNAMSSKDADKAKRYLEWLSSSEDELPIEPEACVSSHVQYQGEFCEGFNFDKQLESPAEKPKLVVAEDRKTSKETMRTFETPFQALDSYLYETPWVNKIACCDAERAFYEWKSSKADKDEKPEKHPEMQNPLLYEKNWPNVRACHDAEKAFYEWKFGKPKKRNFASHKKVSGGYYNRKSFDSKNERGQQRVTFSSPTRKGKKDTKDKDNKRKWGRKREGQKDSNRYRKDKCNASSGGGTISDKIASCRQHIQKSLGEVEEPAKAKPSKKHDDDVANRLTSLENANVLLTSAIEDLRKSFAALAAMVQKQNETKAPTPQKQEPKKEEKVEEEDDDDGVDLFGSESEEEDEEAKKEREKRLAAYAAKKAKKPGPIAKSNVIFDVKPWDDETDMKEMENLVRTIEMDGLLWGASKLVPLAYGIQKLQISSVVEDEKVSIDELQEKIEEFEDLVQSVDIAAFNKI